MKKFILFSILFMVAMIGISQERSLPSATSYYVFDRGPLDANYSYLAYTGTTSDYLLPTTRDTIDFRYDTKASSLYDFDAILTYDKIVGIDTTVTVQMLGRNSDNESWTTISTHVSSVVSGLITQSIASSKTATVASAVDFLQQTIAANKDTLTVATRTITYTEKTRFRFLTIRCILTGNDSVGTGIKIKKVELKLWK